MFLYCLIFKESGLHFYIIRTVIELIHEFIQITASLKQMWQPLYLLRLFSQGVLAHGT